MNCPLSSSRAVTTRRQKVAGSRAAILEAAEHIFAEAGLAGARTDAIAAKAGVNKALLYYYFKSKEDLYYAVLEDRLKEFHACALEALSGSASARSTLLRFVSVHFDFISERPYYPRLFQRLMMTGGKPLERLARRFFVPISRKLVRVVRRGIEGGEFRPADEHHTAISLVALTVFYFSAAPIVRVVGHIDPYGKTNLARRKAEVLDFIRFGLFLKPDVHVP